MDFFWAIGVPKNIKKFSKNIDKTPYIRVAQKIYNFAQGVSPMPLFFTPPVFIIMSWNIAGRK